MVGRSARNESSHSSVNRARSAGSRADGHRRSRRQAAPRAHGPLRHDAIVPTSCLYRDRRRQLGGLGLRGLRGGSRASGVSVCRVLELAEASSGRMPRPWPPRGGRSGLGDGELSGRGLEPGVEAHGEERLVVSSPKTRSTRSASAVPKRPASGVLSFTGGRRSDQGGGGRKNQPIGSSKARAKATISSASKLRMNLPATERSAWETLALDQRLPR